MVEREEKRENRGKETIKKGRKKPLKTLGKNEENLH